MASEFAAVKAEEYQCWMVILNFFSRGGGVDRESSLALRDPAKMMLLLLSPYQSGELKCLPLAASWWSTVTLPAVFHLQGRENAVRVKL